LLSWLRWVITAETKAEVAADDPLPFIRGTVWRLRAALPRALLGRPAAVEGRDQGSLLR